MKHKDLRWRLAGVALFTGAGFLCLVLDGRPLSIFLYPLALTGLPLMIHGRSAYQLCRAIIRGHESTIDAVRAARMRR